MGIIARFFGTASRLPAPTSRMSSQISSGMPQPASSQTTTRRELLRVVLRDTLNRQGIPTAWISGEVLTSTSRTGERGIHWRLLVKHWDVRVVTHAVAIQHALIKRVMTFDPMASAWLTGISWQFALEDESVCPPLPHPGTWTVSAPPPAPAQPIAPAHATAGGDVIAGPVRIGDARTSAMREADAAKADLDRLLAVRDADFRSHAGEDHEATQPMWPKTEPGRL